MQTVKEFYKEILDFKFSQNTKYFMMMGLFTYGLSNLYSDYKSDIVLMYTKT